MENKGGQSQIEMHNDSSSLAKKESSFQPISNEDKR